MAARYLSRPFVRLGSAAVMLAALAAVSAPAWGLDLLQAYQAAQAQDPRIRAARAARDSALERLPQARSQLLPNLSASMGRNKNDVDLTQQNILGQEAASHDKYFSYNQTVQLRQPLYRKPLGDGLRQAGFIVEDAEATLEREDAEAAGRAWRRWLDIWMTREQREALGAVGSKVLPCR